VLPGRRTAFSLNAVATAIAELLQRPILIETIEQRLGGLFAVDPATCREALATFIADLQARAIIELFEDDGAAARRLYLDLLTRSLTNLIYPEHELRIEDLEANGRGSDRLAHERRLRDLRYRQAGALASLVRHKQEGWSWQHRTPRFAHTMIGLARLDNLEYCAAHVFAHGIAGDFLEAGVLQGGASIFLRALQVAYGHEDRATWLADSFEGPPPATLDLDRRHAPAFTEGHDPWLSASVEAVQDNFRTYDLLSDRVRFLAGRFADTLAAAPIERLAILRFDAGLYTAAMEVLDHLYDKVSPGGFIVIDDYQNFEPCRTAVDEFRARRGDAAPLKRPDWNSVYWQKA
jgi:O-methyltransferase